jgi:hypothetical protein
MKSDRAGHNPSGTPYWIPVTIVAIIGFAVIAAVLTMNQKIGALEEKLSYTPSSGSGPAAPAEPVELSGAGHAVYVPVYSHIYSLGGKPMLLETTLSVRNTDVSNSMVLGSVRYFDTDGNEVRNFLDAPITIGPLATAEFLVEAKDTSGGSGANFVVEWMADAEISEPIIEAIMVGLDGTHGLAFRGEGEEINTVE